MKKVVSNEQRLANRQNAQQSTGPQTPSGKTLSARSSRHYSTFDNRQFSRALPELRRLRAVPHYDTHPKKRTRKTNPFETDT